MSQTEVQVQLAEAIGAINNLATELKHYTEAQEAHKAETKERIDKSEADNKERFNKNDERYDKIDGRVRSIEVDMPTLKKMEESSQTIKNSVIANVVVLLFVGAMFAYFMFAGGK